MGGKRIREKSCGMTRSSLDSRKVHQGGRIVAKMDPHGGKKGDRKLKGPNSTIAAHNKQSESLSREKKSVNFPGGSGDALIREGGKKGRDALELKTQHGEIEMDY